MLGARGRRAGRGRETDGVPAATWPDQGGSGTLLPKVCSALLPALLPLARDFLSVPRAQRTNMTSSDGDGLFGCAWPPPRPVYRSHGYWAPAQPRASFVVRFPLQEHLILQSCTFGDFECRRDCCLLLCECPTSRWLRWCAQVQSVAPPRPLLKEVSMRLRRSSFEHPTCAVLQGLSTG